jgi:hypothetical protein
VHQLLSLQLQVMVLQLFHLLQVTPVVLPSQTTNIQPMEQTTLHLILWMHRHL